MAKVMTRESLAREVASSPVSKKYAKRLALLETARKVAGVKPLTEYQKYYIGTLFDNIATGNKYAVNEAYTQASNAGAFRRDVMNITSIAVQNTILPELVSVQPMTSEYQSLPIMEFKYGTNKGETRVGDTVLDSTGAGKTDFNYDSKDVVNQPVETGITSYLIPFTPVTPGTVVVNVAGTTYTDDGNGAITGLGTINYETGAVTFTNATSANTTISFEYDNSVIPNYLYPELDGHDQHQVGDVTMNIRPVEMRAFEHKIRAFYGLTAAYRFQKEFGINLPQEFNKQVANEMNKERERKVFNDLYIGAAGGNAIVWSATPRPGVSDEEHVQSLPICINLAVAEIASRNGMNLYPNFVVGGANVIAYLQRCRDFRANEAPRNGGSYLAGTLGNLKVFMIPSLATNDFVVGTVGNDFWQAGYVVGDYMPLTKTTPVTLADYNTQEGWVSIYANKLVTPTLYARGRITN